MFPRTVQKCHIWLTFIVCTFLDLRAWVCKFCFLCTDTNWKHFKERKKKKESANTRTRRKLDFYYSFISESVNGFTLPSAAVKSGTGSVSLKKRLGGFHAYFTLIPNRNVNAPFFTVEHESTCSATAIAAETALCAE